jgi:hypothetical protein
LAPKKLALCAATPRLSGNTNREGPNAVAATLRGFP